MVNLMADTGLMGLDTASVTDDDDENSDPVEKVFIYEPKLSLSPKVY